jgi:hypothetical protein
MAEYRAWRHGRGGPALLVCDIDQLEYRYDGEGWPEPVAVLEVTRYDGAGEPPRGYFEAILDRYVRRDGQAKAIKVFASMLGCKAFIVLYRRDVSRFWLYNLSDNSGVWQGMSSDGYLDFLKRLPTKGGTK